MKTSIVLLACLLGGLIAGGLRDPWAWTAASAAIWVLVISLSRRLSLGALKPWIPWLCWAAVSAAASSQPFKSLYPFSRWAGIIGYFWLARCLWGEEDRRRWFWGLCACAFVLGLAAVWTGGRELLAHGSGELMFGLIPPYYNYTVFVESAAIAAILAALGHRQGPQGRLRKLLWGLLVFLFALLVLARARAGILAVFGAAALAVLRQGQARRLVILALVLVLGVAAMTVAVVGFRRGSLAHMLKPDKARVFKRPQLWKAGLEVAKDHPLLGEGLGNFESGFLRHNFPSHYRVTNFQFTTAYAHSEPLQLAAETGWVGLALFLAALIASLRIPRPSAASCSQEAALCAGAAMGAQCLVDNMLHMPALAMLFFSAIACSQGKAQEKGAVCARRVEVLGLAGLALALAAWVPGFLVRTYQERLRDEEDPAQRLELAQSSVRIFPADPALREDLARAFLALSLPRPGDALEQFERASRLNPTNALYPVMRAEILRSQGRWQQVLGLAEEGVGLEPNFLQARLLRAEAWAREGKKELARAELSEVRRRRAELEKARLYAGDRSLYTGYDFTVGSYDARRLELVSRLAR